MRVDWKRFSDDLATWERSTSHERFVHLCNAFERAIRRAFKRDPLLEHDEVLGALEAVAQEVGRMKREYEGRKPCERITVEVESGLAGRLRAVAAREGLETGELLALLIDRQLLSHEVGSGRRGGRRKSRGDD